jgi:hypothetical protein
MCSFVHFHVDAAVVTASDSWMHSQSLQAKSRTRAPLPIPSVTVDLDLAPEDRWTHIANSTRFKSLVPAIRQYLQSEVPSWAVPIIDALVRPAQSSAAFYCESRSLKCAPAGQGKGIRPYFSEYGAEIESLASTLGMPIGELVALNLIMQLEQIGLNCSRHAPGNDDANTHQ